MCEYCESENSRNVSLKFFKDFANNGGEVRLFKKGRTYNIGFELGRYSTYSKPINFCPMCGRKLGGEQMLNSYNDNLKINAVSGTMVKNYRKSFFCIRGSNAYIFEEYKPRLTESGSEIVVIQAMMLSETLYMCEVMYKGDFDELFEKEEQGNG